MDWTAIALEILRAGRVLSGVAALGMAAGFGIVVGGFLALKLTITSTKD